MKFQNKIAIILVAIAATFATASAQMRTSYFMEGSYFRTDMNAALTPYRGYVKMPLIGGLGVDLSNNYLSVNNFFFKKNGGVYTFMYDGVSNGEFLNKLSNKGKISFNLNNSLIGFGAHAKKFFWSFGVNLRSQSEITLSKNMFAALKNLSNGFYDLGDTHISNREYMEIAMGFAIPLKDFMTFGFRAKGLIGIADISMSMDKMYLDINRNAIKAEFMGSIRGNCPMFAPRYMAGSPLSMDGIMQQDISKALNNVKSWGLALDLGFEFRFLDDHLKVSIAANDLGFIKWYSGSTINAQSNAHFSYAGFDLEAGKAKLDSGFDATMAQPGGAYTTRLSGSLNAGVEYNILNNQISFGLLSHTEFCQNFTRSELTASVNFRVARWFSTSLSHTFLNGNKFGVLGFALNFHPTGFNFFLGADFIDTRYAVLNRVAIPKMMSSANFYFGLGFNFGKPHFSKYIQVKEKSKSKGRNKNRA